MVQWIVDPNKAAKIKKVIKAAGASYEGSRYLGPGQYLIMAPDWMSREKVMHYAKAPPEVLEKTVLQKPKKEEKAEVGTWIDPETGRGYSGPRKDPSHIPASPTTGKPLRDVAKSEGKKEETSPYEQAYTSKGKQGEQKVSMSPKEAYKAGVISKNEYENVRGSGARYELRESTVRRAEEAKKTLKKRGTKVPETHSALRYMGWERKSEEIKRTKKREYLEERAEHPLLKTSYVINRDWFGMGTVAEYATQMIIGGEWEERRKQMMISYASELYGKKKPMEVGGVPFSPAASAVAGGKSLLFALPSGAAGRTAQIAATTAGRLIYGTVLGTQIGKTIKKPTFENIARSAVYATPLALEAATKLPPVKERLELYKMTRGMSKSQKKLFKKQMRMARELKGVRPAVKEITMPRRFRGAPKAWKATKSYMRGKDVTVGGSVAGKTQMYGRGRAPIDIDLFVRSPSKAASNLFGLWKSTGVKGISLKISKKGTVMEAGKLFVGGKKAAEFHTTQWMRRFPFTGRTTKTPSGIKVIQYGEQLRRKAYGGALGRPKDVEDFFRMARSGVKTKKYFPQRSILPDFLAGRKKGTLSFGMIKKAESLKIGEAGMTGKTVKGYTYSLYPPSKPYVPYKPYKPSVEISAPPYKPYKTYNVANIIPAPPAVSPYEPYRPGKPTYVLYKPAEKPPYKLYKPGKIAKKAYKPYKPKRKVEPGYPPYSPVKFVSPPPERRIKFAFTFGKIKAGKPPKTLDRPLTLSKKKYEPSLGGLVSGKKIKRAPKGTLTGLGVRYMVERGGKKKRKKKKKELRII